VEENKLCRSKGSYFIGKGSGNYQLGTEFVVHKRKAAVVTECHI
jgi:hypothetical protein